MTCYCFKCQEKDKENNLTEPKWNNNAVHCSGCGVFLGFVNYYPDGGMNCSSCQHKGYDQHEKTEEKEGSP